MMRDMDPQRRIDILGEKLYRLIGRLRHRPLAVQNAMTSVVLVRGFPTTIQWLDYDPYENPCAMNIGCPYPEPEEQE